MTPARATGILGDMDLVELSRRLANLIRLGTIHSVDHAARVCRVQTGALTTQWMPWIERRAGETTTWDPPTVGEQCVVLSPSGAEAGVVFLGLPSDQIAPPSHAPVAHVIKFPDGAVFSYDHDASHLEISGIKTATIVASESITNNTPLTHMTGQCVVDGLFTYNNGLAGHPGEHGSYVTGGFHNVGGEVSSNGIVLDTHVHGDVEPGPGTTGGPQ